jgi:uncharacterized protein (TIGR01777 family)
MMKIIVAGGSGMIGQRLTRSLVDGGHKVWVLTRSPGEVELPPGAMAERWDARTSHGWGRLVEEADAIINLAGSNIGALPWTNARKRSIRESRVNAGQAIVEAVRQSTRRPRSVLQIVGIGYYGNSGDRPLYESDPAGEGFQASVVKETEDAISPVAGLGPRLAIMRTGVVLTEQGGILAPFILQNRLFLGGPLGSGKQWISWIHIHDLIRAFTFLLEKEGTAPAGVQEVFNVSAPEPLTNTDFGRTVARVMHRPFWAPVPSFALKIVLGEMSALIFEGQRAIPARLQEIGFQFEFDTLEKALRDLIQ